MRQISIDELSNYTTQARGLIDHIYLHHTAGTYEQVFSDYHLNITGDGEIYTDMKDFTEKKHHTWMRNSRSIGIALCCAKDAKVWRNGNTDYGEYPPTYAQIDMLGQVVAKLLVEIGIPLSCVYTHGEIADIDGYGIWDDDPDMRWDLRGYESGIRETIEKYIRAWGALYVLR